MVNILLSSLTGFFTRLALSLISEKMLEWALFEIAERIVKSTATPHDDVWFEKIKEAFEESKK